MKAFPTEHNGYIFRSQLEARWAWFFDSLLIPYIYELDGYQLNGGALSYRPDFWLPKHNRFVEIKPYTPSRTELAKAYYLALESHKNVFMLCGDPYGLLEAHEFYYIGSDAIEIMRTMESVGSKLPGVTSVLSIPDRPCVKYDKGSRLRYIISLDICASIGAATTDDLQCQFDFVLDYDDVSLSELDGVLAGFDDLNPALSPAASAMALAARKHQFWRPS